MTYSPQQFRFIYWVHVAVPIVSAVLLSIVEPIYLVTFIVFIYLGIAWIFYQSALLIVKAQQQGSRKSGKFIIIQLVPELGAWVQILLMTMYPSISKNDSVFQSQLFKVAMLIVLAVPIIIHGLVFLNAFRSKSS